MNLRERLLAHLREPDYSPGNEYDLAQRLGLNKKHRAMLAHEVRLVLKGGEFARAQNGRIAKRGAEGERKRPEARPIFVPAKLRAAANSAGARPTSAQAPATPQTRKPRATALQALRHGIGRTRGHLLHAG